MSEERIIPDAAEFASAASRATVLCTNSLQSLLVAVVVLWVLDVPRRVFNISLYTEQMLTVCLGLTLALAFVADTSRKRHWSDWVAMALSPVPAALSFLPTMQSRPPGSGRVRRMVPPPHSGAGAAAPERRGGTAAMRRWAGALRLGARHGGGT